MIQGKKISFDIDGVLCDFIRGFGKLAKLRGFVDYELTTENQEVWQIEDIIGKENSDIIWEEYIDNNNYWWKGLRTLIKYSTFRSINFLNQDNHIYFLTSRKGKSVQWQTNLWLGGSGIDRPNVILNSNKNKICRLLGIDYHIDDKLEQANDIALIPGSRTKSFLINRKYNQKEAAPGVIRVNSV